MARLYTKKVWLNDQTKLSAKNLNHIEKGIEAVAGAIDELEAISKKVMTDDERAKLNGIDPGAQVNKIESIKVNGTEVKPNSNKEVNIPVDASGAAEKAVSAHNTSSTAHSDIRTLVSNAQTAADNAQTKANEIEELIVNGVIDGSPKGVYANLSALQTAFPSGASGVYITEDDGYWNYWNGTEWKKGRVYITDPSYDEVKGELNNYAQLYVNFERKRFHSYGFVTVDYAISITTPISFDNDLLIEAREGYKFKVHYWSTNSVGQENYLRQGQVFGNKMYIPKNTFFTIELRKNDDSTITLDDKTNVFSNKIPDYISYLYVNDYIKSKFKMAYWDKTNKIFPSSTSVITATEILYADVNIPVILKDHSKQYFIVYYVDSEGTQISNSGYLSVDYVIPEGSYFVLSFRNPSSTSITNFEELVDNICFGFTSLYFTRKVTSINGVYPDDKGNVTIEVLEDNNIIKNNVVATETIINTHYLGWNDNKRFSLLHFSDIHANSKELERIIKYRDYISDYLDDTICTGDNVYGVFSNEFNYWINNNSAKNILLAVGNHDSFSKNSFNDSDLVSMSDVSNKFFNPLISNWNVTNYTSGNTYYYKDYVSKNIRLIVLDSQRIGVDATNQLNWLNNALSDAITNNLQVIIAMHYFPSQNIRMYDCSFSMYQYRGYNLTSNFVGFDVVGTVDTFIENGGTFITYLVGHKHADGFGYVDGHQNQTVSIVTCATFNSIEVSNYGDQARKEGHKCQDAFNLITVDPDRKYLQVIRVGADINMFGLERKNICFNYANKTFIKS